MTEKEYLAHKIPILMKEGRSKAQAIAISFAIYNSEKKKMQNGGGFFDYENQTYDNPYFGQLNLPKQNPMEFDVSAPDTSMIMAKPNLKQDNLDRIMLDKQTTDYQEYVNQNDPYLENKSNPNVNYEMQVYNPFGGVSLEQSLYTLGQGIGQKDAGKTALGAGLSALKLGRIGLAGYSTGKEDRRVEQDFYKNLTMDRRPIQSFQEGGNITNSQMLTGKYIADEGQGNVELENREIVKDNQTGNIQEVVGDTHKNGGVKATLKDSKVLSDYTKIGAKNAKELKNRYDITVKASDTFAKVMDKMNKKIGVKEATEELEGYIEKVGDNNSIKDTATKKLNEEYLTKEIEEYQTKLDELSGAQNAIFEDLFDRQEAIPKLGSGNEILDDKGNVIQDRGEEEMFKKGGEKNSLWKNIRENRGSGKKPTKEMLEQEAKIKRNMQQGGAIYELASKYDISPERAEELITMQMGGEMPQEGQMQEQVSQEEQIIQIIMQMLQQGSQPEEVIQSLISQGLPQEVATQMVQSVVEQGNPQMQVAQQGARINNKYENPELFIKQTATDEDWKSFGEILKTNPKEATSEIKRLHPELYSQFFVDGKLPKSKVLDFQNAIDKKYENILNDAKIFYKDNPEKIKELENQINQDRFVEYSMENPSVRGRDNKLGNYTATRPNFAFDVLPKEDLEKVNKSGVNTASELKAKFPDLYNKYIEPKGLKSDFWLGQVKQPIPEKKLNVYQNENNQDNTQVETKTKMVFPNLPVDYILPPSAMQSIVKPYVPFGKIDPLKISAEPMLAEVERQRATQQEQLRATGLPMQVQQALQASSTINSNDAIGKAEMFNAEAQSKADQFNLNQTTKEDLTNTQFNQDYQDKMMRTMANQESAMRRYYNALNDRNRQNFMDVRDINTLNAGYDKFKTDGSNIIFNPSQALKPTDYTAFAKWYNSATPQERDAFKKQVINANS